MLGISQTLYIVIAAVVILVVALVVITIFGQGITSFASLAEAKAHCEIQGRASCQATRSLPLTWSVSTVNVNGVPQSCETATNKPANDGCGEWLPANTS